ncbi:MAG: hypothetical protein ACI4E0_07820 [Blautia sp.]
MTKEIGGYLELDRYHLPMLHEDAIALNSGRNCLAYLIQKKGIKRIWIPKFLCASVSDVCRREGCEVCYYSIGIDFTPVLAPTDDWVYLVNYYGQVNNDRIREHKNQYPNLIVDNVQAYYQPPVEGIDTIYTCRKYFGVSDGAFLYTDAELEELEQDESFERVKFLLGRFERNASEFYSDFVSKEEEFSNFPVRRMSKLTYNLLHGIDYEMVKNRRTENFSYLHTNLKDMNELNLSILDGAYMYPLYIENGFEIRKKLQAKKIYVPTLWPDVFSLCGENELEYSMAKNILPIPVDQRYDIENMEYIVDSIKDVM